MQNLRKRMLVGFAAALAAVGFAGSASALSLSLEFAGGATTLNLTPGNGSDSSTFTVQLFADLSGGGGGGVFFVAGSVSFSSTLTPLRCKEQGGTFNNGVGGVPTWSPFTGGCGSPAGGIAGQNVNSIELGVGSGTAGGTFGKLRLGTITFHVNGIGTDTITPFYILAVDGFLQNDGTTFTSTAPVFSAFVNHNIIPEPATAVLLGLGILGLGVSGRRRRRG